MLMRSESAQKSGFVPKSRPLSPNTKFRYFGDDSQISSLASIHYKKSGDLLGTRFTDSSLKFSNISGIDSQSIKKTHKQNHTYKYPTKLNNYSRIQDKVRNNLQAPSAKSEISQIDSVKNSSVGGLKSEIGQLTGRLKNLEGLLSTLAQNQIKTRQQINSLRRCVSQKSLGKNESHRAKLVSPSYSNNYFHNNDSTDIADLLSQNLHSQIKRDLKRKQKNEFSCKCTGFKEGEKDQMSGIIFELYEENKFYEKQLSKMGELKKSSVLKNKARINELLSKMRNI